MNAAVLRRFVVMLAIAAFVLVTVWAVIRPYFFDAPPGDFQTRQGDILLTDHKWDEALERFEAALAVSPNHRGAWMGKAIAYLQSDRPQEAEAAFTHVIEQLGPSVAADDPTGRAVLAGAYANRGILHDRDGRFAAALADYRRALAIDAGAVDGPDLMEKILYGTSQPSTVAKRAAYIERQLALPEDQRLLRVPELDARQRMHKP
ncbi:MAG TPA: tetratricopeptide repeat protein [Rhodospirillales bacterium]|nr:tetratricopeptide repeat protein [Rhodospirillales bacterium]